MDIYLLQFNGRIQIADAEVRVCTCLVGSYCFASEKAYIWSKTLGHQFTQPAWEKGNPCLQYLPH